MNETKNHNAGRKNKPIRILLIVFIGLIILLVGFGIFVWVNYQKMTEELDFDSEEVTEEEDGVPGYPEVTYSGGNAEEMTKMEGETDILLIGVDNREPSRFTGLSDVIMFLRIDTQKSTLKLVSVMRDTLVPIEGHQYNKINAAYNLGGIELAKKTIKSYLGLTPDYYAVINFYGMEDLIDALGGVSIRLSGAEVENMNGSIAELNDIDPAGSAPLVEGSGERHLSGRQAVAYMRIRKVGTDSQRIERQQKVVAQLFSQTKKLGVGQLPGLITALSGCVRTDVKPADKMLQLATTIMTLDNAEIQTYRYPDTYEAGSYKKKDIVQPKNYDAEVKKLHAFLSN